MFFDQKDIHIGRLIELRISELEIDLSRICNFFMCTEEEAKKMYESKSLDCDILLKWSKLLEYDFFRLYSQHLIFYAPPRSTDYNQRNNKTDLPQFRKNIYTRDIVDFILELVRNGTKTKKEVIEQYRIPKATLYKWISKYDKVS
ncbi:hypothetical protein SAMN05421664_3338 [Chryseobacterium soldanellicola]|uniref:Uncharacterized protein n=1 Tax=Chryseobacterium soldanellicola TaxID=311333 RepID=A0A1H1FZG4_9FLAO|nr:transposase [Chryseobacterium soldanellicola]SDR05946.1 hypothetical protein SAMN05421664_3338 [Chryseobacterium soldanellicola]